jgi:transposase
LSREGLNALLPALKKEFPWLGECHSQVLQSVTLNLSKAFINFFEKRAKYPNFKSKHGKQSIQYPQGTKFVDNWIYLPKLGWVKISLRGTNHDRDVNAAQNLKAEGLRLLALGTSATAGGGEVRPTRGRKTATRRSPAKPEAPVIASRLTVGSSLHVLT